MRTLRKTGSSARKTGKQSSRPATVHGNEGQAHRLPSGEGQTLADRTRANVGGSRIQSPQKRLAMERKGRTGELHESWKLLHRED